MWSPRTAMIGVAFGSMIFIGPCSSPTVAQQQKPCSVAECAQQAVDAAARAEAAVAELKKRLALIEDKTKVITYDNVNGFIYLNAGGRIFEFTGPPINDFRVLGTKSSGVVCVVWSNVRGFEDKDCR